MFDSVVIAGAGATLGVESSGTAFSYVFRAFTVDLTVTLHNSCASTAKHSLLQQASV